MNYSVSFTDVQNLIIVAPLLLIWLSLLALCIIKIFREGVSNLNRWAWLAIVILGSLLGSIAFLIVGRRRDQY